MVKQVFTCLPWRLWYIDTVKYVLFIEGLWDQSYKNRVIQGEKVIEKKIENAER